MIPAEFKLENREGFESWYENNYERLSKALFQLQREVSEQCAGLGQHPTVKYRVKSLASIVEKIRRKSCEIPTDLIGIRLICPFIEDIRHCEGIITDKYEVVEREQKGAQYSFHEFGYESIHYLIRLPQHLVHAFDLSKELLCEIQLRTILQDAWAEVEHELVYKADFSPFDEPLRRKLAALNANLSLADIVFQEIRDYQRQLNRQLKRRREDFAERVDQIAHEEVAHEEVTPEQTAPEKNGHYGRLPFGDEDCSFDELPEEIAFSMIPGGETVDNLLLRALHAHNRKQYDEALSLYTRILDSEQRNAVRATIFMHRGMAHVARADYAGARGDFDSAIALDDRNPKGYYYLSMVEQLEGNRDAACEQLSLCLSLDPNRSEALLSRSRLYFEQDRFESALRDCDRAIALRPDWDRALRWRERITAAMNL